MMFSDRMVAIALGALVVAQPASIWASTVPPGPTGELQKIGRPIEFDDHWVILDKTALFRQERVAPAASELQRRLVLPFGMVFSLLAFTALRKRGNTERR